MAEEAQTRTNNSHQKQAYICPLSQSMERIQHREMIFVITATNQLKIKINKIEQDEILNTISNKGNYTNEILKTISHKRNYTPRE